MSEHTGKCVTVKISVFEIKPKSAEGASTAGNGELPEILPGGAAGGRGQSVPGDLLQLLVQQQCADAERKSALLAAFLDECRRFLCSAREQCVQLDIVRFSTVATASEGYGITYHLAHLHLQEKCSYPAATLLQLHCCRQL
eukprot:199529-Pelagomonas_calceolata.AAC.1